jgi:O-antigen/teichoic acid export membrane protein
MDRSLTRQMGALLVGQTVAFAFVFALPLVMARIFSQEDFGLYKQLFLIHSTMVSVLAFGFSASLYYFVPRHASDERLAYIFQTVLILSGLGLLGAYGLVAFKSEVAAALNNPNLEAYMPYLAAFMVVSLVTSVLEILMINLKQAELAAITNLGSELFKAAVMIAVSVWTHSMLALVLAALAWAVCRFIVLIVYLRRWGMAWWLPPARERLIEQFRYSIPFGFALIVWTLANNLHQYVVSSLYNPAIFAIYSVGCLQIPLIARAFESVSDVTLVRLTELQKDGKLQEAAILIGESVTKLGLLFFPLYVWLMVHAHDFIVFLYTERFEASVEIFRVFLTAILLLALELDYVARAFADTGFILKVNAARLALNLVLLWVLVGSMGLVGAALAAVSAAVITKIFTLHKLKTLLKVPIRRLLPWKMLGQILAASLVATAAAWVVPAMLVGASGMRLALSATLFACCYGALIWIGGLIAPGEKRWISETVRKVAWTAVGGFSANAQAAARVKGEE